MKAKDLKPGDAVNGWTVMEVGRARELVEGYFQDSLVLLTIELDVCNDYGAPVATRHRRTWFRADEEVSL